MPEEVLGERRESYFLKNLVFYVFRKFNVSSFVRIYQKNEFILGIAPFKTFKTFATFLFFFLPVEIANLIHYVNSNGISTLYKVNQIIPFCNSLSKTRWIFREWKLNISFSQNQFLIKSTNFEEWKGTKNYLETPHLDVLFRRPLVYKTVFFTLLFRSGDIEQLVKKGL